MANLETVTPVKFTTETHIDIGHGVILPPGRYDVLKKNPALRR